MMVLKKSPLCLAGLVLAGSAAAQTQQTLPVGKIHKGTLYVNSGKLVRDADQKTQSLVTCYTETDTTGFFGVGAATAKGDEWLDWAVMNNKACPSAVTTSDIVGAFQFGYATGVLDVNSGGPGPSIAINFYTGTKGTNGDSLQSCVYSACFSGLPGHNGQAGFGTGWLITLSLTGGSEICLPNTCFGFGMQQGDTDGLGFGFSDTGPLLCQAGDGTGGVDNNGNIDFFSVWSPDSKTQGGLVGNTFGFGSSDHAAWYLTIAKNDFSTTPATAANRNPGGCNDSALTISTPTMGASVSVMISNSLGHASNVLWCDPFPVSSPNVGLGFCNAGGTPGGTRGVLLVSLAIDLCGFGSIALPNPAAVAADAPKDLSLCGLTIYTQSFSFGGGVRPFGPHNGVDLTLGG